MQVTWPWPSNSDDNRFKSLLLESACMPWRPSIYLGTVKVSLIPRDNPKQSEAFVHYCWKVSWDRLWGWAFLSNEAFLLRRLQTSEVLNCLVMVFFPYKLLPQGEALHVSEFSWSSRKFLMSVWNVLSSCTKVESQKFSSSVSGKFFNPSARLQDCYVWRARKSDIYRRVGKGGGDCLDFHFFPISRLNSLCVCVSGLERVWFSNYLSMALKALRERLFTGLKGQSYMAETKWGGKKQECFWRNSIGNLSQEGGGQSKNLRGR